MRDKSDKKVSELAFKPHLKKTCEQRQNSFSASRRFEIKRRLPGGMTCLVVGKPPYYPNSHFSERQR